MIASSRIVRHNGQAVLNGAFGVCKGKEIWSKKRKKMVAVLRLIINLTCSNALQRQIFGDVHMLPFFAQWIGLELLEEEVLLWDAEDMRCAFYVFLLPEAWWPYFALEKPVPGHVVGSKEEWVYLTVKVLPMGWLSAVGVCQYLHRQMLVAPPPLGAGLPMTAELRRDKPLPAGLDRRVRRFFEVYIDNYDSGRVANKFMGQSGTASTATSSWTTAVRQAYSTWGAARAEDKSVSSSLLARDTWCQH